MLDTRTTGVVVSDEAELGAFVDRLAASGADRATELAHAEVRRAIAAGTPPPGLRRLAEALAASVAELPPPRRPSDEPVPLVEAMRSTPLAVLGDDDPGAVAAAVAALVADGHRVVVTADDAAALSAVRDALPPDAARRSVDRLPGLPPADLRELRRLLACSTPGRRARADQELPPPDAVPPPSAVAELCAQVVRVSTAPPAQGTETVPALLDDLEPARRAEVVAVAAAANRAVAALPPRERHPWAWRLLPDMVHNTHGAVEDLRADATAAVRELEAVRHEPAVTITGRLPENAVDLLRRFLEFLDGGGRARSYFRSPAQRDVDPLLGRLDVGGRRPESAGDVRRVVAHLETAARLRRVDELCTGLAIAPPRTEDELVALSAELELVVAAARAVGALRHEVLFLAPQSPVAVPDLDATLRVASAILSVQERGAVLDTCRRLERMADELARRTPVRSITPEHVRAVAALRKRDAADYAEAIAAFGVARREIRDEARCRALLAALADAAPGLAQAWAEPDGDPGAAPGPFGLAAFVPTERLLAALPPPDSADVVVVHRAGGLGLQRLLLAAVAPRLLATGGPAGPAAPAADLLGVLRRAAAPVVGGADARVATGA